MQFGGSGRGPGISSSTPYQEQNTRRQASLVTPITFSVEIGATETTIYTAPSGRDEYLLIRKLMVVNTTAGAIDFVLEAGGIVWVPSMSHGTGTTTHEGLEGMLVDVGENLTATGEGLRVVGWGLRIQGGDKWVL